MRWGDLNRLHWRRLGWFRSDSELRAGQDLVATLAVRGILRREGIVQTSDGAWTFTRAGWMRSRAMIRANGVDAAEYRGSAWRRRGELTFASGRRFGLRANLWLTRLAIRGEADEPLLNFHRRGVCSRTADVEILPAARSLVDLPILITFGWFLFTMLEEDAAVAAG